jgi:predicted transcriptional regulator
VTLTDSQSKALQELSRRKAKTQEEILHEAIEQFIARHSVADSLAVVQRARGMWSERGDSPDFAELRCEAFCE